MMRRTVRETLDVSAAPTCFSKVVVVVVAIVVLVILIYFPADISLLSIKLHVLDPVFSISSKSFQLARTAIISFLRLPQKQSFDFI